jgi:hypothetical protein
MFLRQRIPPIIATSRVRLLNPLGAPNKGATYKFSPSPVRLQIDFRSA